MNIDYLITLLNNRLAYLGPLKVAAERDGDLAQVDQIEKQIIEVNETLYKLKSLLN